jgi:hypothetical protein
VAGQSAAPGSSPRREQPTDTGCRRAARGRGGWRPPSRTAARSSDRDRAARRGRAV